MAHNWRYIYVLVTLFALPTALRSDDLLDQYVRHVERVNRINYQASAYDDSDSNQRNSDRSASVKFLDRYFARRLKSSDQVSSDNNYIPLSDIPSSDSRDKRDVSSDIFWTHSEVLDKEGLVTLRWQPRHQEILFRVEAKTRGYVGIGFSPDGKMESADIVLAWVDDRFNRPFLMDCHGVPKSQGSAPVKDEIDNYTLMRGTQNDTHTIIEFRRVLDTCDPDDFVLSEDTVRVIWALHDQDPRLGAEMVYHEDNRGTQSIHLLGPPPVPNMLAGHSTHWDVVFQDLRIKNDMNTMYWCKVFKAPTLNQEHHIVGFEPIIGYDHENMVHHMIMHECELDGSDNVGIWEKFAEEKGRLCYSNMPPEWEKCLTPLVAWAVGSKGENFPNHIGLPLANKKHSFYMLEVHFDNPTMRTAIATTGLRLHYTNELRENKGGILITGVAPSTLHFIPPYQKEYKTAGYCSLNCTKETVPKTGINVVSVMMHSHLAARRLKLRHIRAGRELPPLSEDDHYDFNYQQARMLSQDTLILPGDGLITECTYSTQDREKPTLGGYSTKEEMCLAFVLYYPRIQLAGCYSIPPVKYFFEALGIKEFYGKNMTEIERAILEGSIESDTPSTTTSKPFVNRPGDELSPEANRRAIIALRNAKEYSIEGENGEGKSVFDRLIIKEPAEFKNLTLTDHLHNMPYNETIVTQKMEEYFYTGLHLTFCRKRDDTLAIRETVERLPSFQNYEKRVNVQCSYRSKIPFVLDERIDNSGSTVKQKIMWTIIFTVFILIVNWPSYKTF